MSQLQLDETFAYRVFTETQGKEILQVCRSQSINAILLDCSSSDVIGLNLISQLKQHLGENCPPIVVIGSGDAQMAVQAFKSGATDYLIQERMTPEQLRSTLCSVVNAQRCQNQLQASVETMLDCFGIFSSIRDESGQIVDFRIDYLNQAACDNNQLPKEMQIGRPLCEILPQHRESGLFDDYCQLVKTGEPLIKQALTYEDIYGEKLLVRAFDIRASKLNDGFVASWRDITETVMQHKQAQAAIAQLNRDLMNRVSELQTLLDTIPVGIAIANDPDCTQMQSNAYIRQLLGIRPGVNISKSAPANAQPPYRVFRNGQEILAEDLPMQLAARLGVEVRDIEFDMLLADGTVRQLLAYAAPLRGDQNELRGAVGAFLDITERKQFIAAIQASQQRYQELAEAMPQMVWTADTTGAVNYWNQRWYEYTGLSVDESMGAAGASTLHPEDRDRTLEHWSQSVSNGSSFEMEYRIRRWDGVYHWFISRGIPTKDHKGQSTGWLGTITDIDHHKRLEEQLRLVLQAVNGLVFDFDLITNNVYRSEKLFDLIGVHAADAPPTATWWRERIHPDDIARLQGKLPELLAGANDLYEAEYRVRHEDGHWVDIWERGCLVRQQGQVIRIVGSTVDISERKQVELNLREAHIQLEAALAAGSVYTWRWNIPDNRLIINRSLAHLFGVDPEGAAKGLPIEHFLNAIHPLDQAQVTAAIEVAIATGEEYATEYRIRNASGEERWVIARGRVEYDTNGNAIAFPGALADISQRKQAELERQRSEALLRGFMAASPIALALFDRELRFLYANEALAQINGLPLSEHFGRTLWEVVPQMAPQFAPMLLQIMETQQPVLNLNFNGEVRPGVFRNTIANHYPVCLPNGEVIGVGVAVMDVSDLTQTQQQLRESEERFRTLADNISQLAWMTDETGYIVWYNQRWFEYTGTTLEEMQGWGWQKVHHPDYVESVTKKLRQHLETGEIWEDTFPLLGKDGRYRWFLSRAVPVRDQQGKVLRWFGTNTDITERQEAQEKLQKSEAEFRTISNAAPALVWVCDAEGKNVFFNERWYEYTGQTTADASGFGWVEVMHPEDAARIIPYWQHCQKTGKIYEGEVRYLRHDGEYRWHVFRALPRRGATGDIEAWYGLSIDINDRKQAQAALQERSQHIQLLYETTRDLLSSSQPLTLAETIFKKLKAMMGVDVYLNYILDEQQQKLHLTSHAGIPQKVTQQIEWLELGETICSKVAQQGCQIVRGDIQQSDDPKLQLARSLGVTACACQPLIVQGKVFGTLSFGSLNRTEFTPSEQSLFQAICDQIAIALERSQLLTSLQQQTEELMRVNRIKDEFLAVLSHELRSPLNPILGWTRLLQKRKLDPAKTAEALATIERNAKLQTQLIDDLLDIAKILRGKLTLQIAPVDLVFVVEAAIDTVTAAAIAKNIILHPILPQIGQVAGDAVRLQQVVWNLLSNAIKFTPNHGRVDIQLQRVGNQAQITVSDTGKGINPSFLPHIFESFCQEDASTTRKFGGLGLGLAIVRQLVEAHGGTITAQSKGEGLGATFTVQLPLVNIEPETPQPEAVFEPEPDLTGMRVLIVDDEPDARELIAVMLNQYGAQTMTLTSAKEVLATLESFQPNILVSDIGMPEVDGYSLMRQIRALPATKGGQIPAIALTAYAGEMNHQQAISAGFQRHLSKPVDFDILVRAIAELWC